MKISAVFPWKSAVFFTLFFFAAALSAAGCISLIDRNPPSDTPSVSEEISGSTAEVFSPSPQPTPATVFRGFVCPVTGPVSSPYGYRQDPFSGQTKYHKGLDIAVEKGTPVKSVFSGTVTESGYNSVGGNYIVIDHGNSVMSYYGHLQVSQVSVGDSVKTGDIIGKSGNTGKVTGAHLHFQLSYNGRTVNPQTYLDFSHEV